MVDQGHFNREDTMIEDRNHKPIFYYISPISAICPSCERVHPIENGINDQDRGYRQCRGCGFRGYYDDSNSFELLSDPILGAYTGVNKTGAVAILGYYHEDWVSLIDYLRRNPTPDTWVHRLSL